MSPIIKIKNLSKIYDNKHQALNSINLDIHKGEVLSLLGPNGAGKTTLISIICGLTNLSSGSITVDEFDILKAPNQARKLIGLVPQELTINMFETVWDTINFSRGLFGLPKNSSYLEDLLKKLSLTDKRNNPLMTLSGGMKRRVMIAKALAHEPKVLFLDEPTAGVDVELRRDMWQQIQSLKDSGVTIILTTHYIEEAEEMADRIGVINKGKLILVEQKNALISKLGKREMQFKLKEPLDMVPSSLNEYELSITDQSLIYSYNSKSSDATISNLIEKLHQNNIVYTDIQSKQSSLEDIFVELVKKS